MTRLNMDQGIPDEAMTFWGYERIARMLLTRGKVLAPRALPATIDKFAIEAWASALEYDDTLVPAMIWRLGVERWAVRQSESRNPLQEILACVREVRQEWRSDPVMGAIFDEIREVRIERNCLRNGRDYRRHQKLTDSPLSLENINTLRGNLGMAPLEP